MSKDWETAFLSWSKPPSDTEQEKCENAERMVKGAISDSRLLNTKNISVFSQGSYQNNTNVRQDSDVDVCVFCRDTVVQEFALAPLRRNVFTALAPASYLYSQFKNDVQSALSGKFGYANVSRGDKAFDLHANTYRINADVVPALELIVYLPFGQEIYGTCILSDTGTVIYNFPKQHYENGVEKNKRTGGRFKHIVRVMKRLRNEMDDSGVVEAKKMSSFLLECLVFIVPDIYFFGSSYKEITERVIVYLWDVTKSGRECGHLLEINNIKLLFGQHQKWSQVQVNNFMLKAFTYMNNN